MRLIALLVMVFVLLVVSGCDRSSSSKIAGVAANRPESQPAQIQTTESYDRATNKVQSEPGSLKQLDSASSSTQAVTRKIIRNANIALEVSSPGDAQPTITTIAAAHQGYVVTTESTQRTDQDQTKPSSTVTLVIRVPEGQFEQTVADIRAAGIRVVNEKLTGQDVTEEFMDLEARVKNQKALELQFIEIMKRANTVEDALNVQSELANVRTEIERLEGRRRFLENQTSLSTINVTLQSPTQIVNATGFWYKVKSAFADGAEAAAEVVLFLIRAVVALLPVVLLIVLPLALLAKLFLGRLRKRRRVKIDEPQTTS